MQRRRASPCRPRASAWHSGSCSSGCSRSLLTARRRRGFVPGVPESMDALLDRPPAGDPAETDHRRPALHDVGEAPGSLSSNLGSRSGSRSWEGTGTRRTCWRRPHGSSGSVRSCPPGTERDRRVGGRAPAPEGPATEALRRMQGSSCCRKSHGPWRGVRPRSS